VAFTTHFILLKVKHSHSGEFKAVLPEELDLDFVEMKLDLQDGEHEMEWTV